LLNKIYNNMVEKSHLYEVSFGINFYKKIRWLKSGFLLKQL
jgi:hypothetical protein